MDSLSDEVLVIKSLEDMTFFGVLVERYERKLLFYILRISHFTEMETEEIIQDTFLKAWKNLNNFDPDLKFSTWIYRIAHNETISLFRKSQSRGQHKKIDIEPEYFEKLVSDMDFLSELDAQFRAELVGKALGNLPEKYKQVLVLRYFEDKNYEEIADILQKPSGTVATLLNRAKGKLKSIIESQKLNV